MLSRLSGGTLHMPGVAKLAALQNSIISSQSNSSTTPPFTVAVLYKNNTAMYFRLELMRTTLTRHLVIKGGTLLVHLAPLSPNQLWLDHHLA